MSLIKTVLVDVLLKIKKVRARLILGCTRYVCVDKCEWFLHKSP
jgi:hypothetical protein